MLDKRDRGARILEMITDEVLHRLNPNGEDCWHCGGEGETHDCIDNCCEDAESGCELCSRRCIECVMFNAKIAREIRIEVLKRIARRECSPGLRCGVSAVTKPIRIQRKRTKGAKLPDGTVVVTRGTKWGNPAVVNPRVTYGSGSAYAPNVTTAAEAVAFYRDYLKECPDLIAALPELRGKNLACFCALDQPCHADVLLELANA